MKSTKLVDILRGFNSNEMKQFRSFLPYGLSNVEKLDVAATSITQLFDFLNSYHPDFNAAELTDEAAFFYAFGQVPFSKNKLSRLQSVLLREVEKFIACHQTLSNNFQKDIQVTRFYANRGLTNRFSLALVQLKKELESEPKYDKGYFLNHLLIELMVSEFQSLRNTRRDNEYTINSLESLDTFFLVTRLEWILWSISQNRLIELDLEPVTSVLPELDKLIEKLQFDKRQPIVQLYRLAIDVLRDNNHFDDFCQILSDNESNLSFEQNQMFHAIERNYCTAQLNRGKEEYRQKIFPLLQKHLAEGYLYYKGNCLIPATLQNIVTLGLRRGELAYVKSVLEQFKGRLYGTEEAEQIEAYNWANYYFHLGQFQTAFDTLPNHRFKDLYYDLGCRRLDIQILYELQEIDLLDAKLNAFKNYLFERSNAKENPLPTYYADMNNNFVNLVKRLQNTTKSNAIKLHKNLELLQTNYPYAEREWLTKKIKEQLR